MIHQKRRQALLAQLPNNSVVILSTNSEKQRCGDVHYPFRADSNFYYLTGFKEPEALMVLSQQSYQVFLRPRNPEREIWDGERLGVERACQALGADQAYAVDELDQQLPALLEGAEVVYFDHKGHDLDQQVTQLLSHYTTKDPKPILAEMRLIKDEGEIDTMRRAAEVSTKAHTLAMQSVKPNMLEYELQAVFEAAFKKAGGEHAYTPIVAGGKNACILHYINNDQPLKDGELVLIDAGCELDYYASDITRTFPVNGRFSEAQKAIYQLVLDAQLAAIECIKPGAKTDSMHRAATHVITQGLISLGLLERGGDLSQFFMHGTGHWLGLDVHDVGAYQIDNQPREFVPGMITTVEPGIYIREDAKIDPAYHNIGVRIEDNVLVTSSGHEVLTQAVVKEITHIEKLMQ